uniref:Uncharacterized protein n=1 Tax=Lates calcarifer TaxID=8187 RepID=A0A4W6ENI8_LATCA
MNYLQLLIETQTDVDSAFILDISCPICSLIFTEPVVLQCGHSFCRSCMHNCREGKISRTCPICRHVMHDSEPPMNFTLKNLCENYRKRSQGDLSGGHRNDSESYQVKVTVTGTQQKLPGNPEHNNYPQVLGCEGFDSGKHCWEVVVGSCTRWVLGVVKEARKDRKEEMWSAPQNGLYTIMKKWCGRAFIGVAYRRMCRKGEDSDSWLGHNDSSWGLTCNKDSYRTLHKGISTAVTTPPNSNKVGVFLDWSAGTLAFYRVSCGTLTLLHTFHTTFTEPVYPAFHLAWVDSTIYLC